MRKQSISKKDILESIEKSKKQDSHSLREELAYLYHVIDFHGWGDLILTHASVRIPDTQHFLMAPYGLMFCEVTPENLVEVNSIGKIINNSEWRVNFNGSKSHQAIYAAREDVNAIIHTHTTHGVALANLNTDLKCLDQMSMMFYGKIGYHDYGSFFTHQSGEKDHSFISSLANNKCMILKNHGLLAVGKSIAEAFWNYYYFELACQIQLKALSAGRNNLVDVDERIKKEIEAQFDRWNEAEENGFPGHADLAFAAAKRKLYIKKYYE